MRGLLLGLGLAACGGAPVAIAKAPLPAQEVAIPHLPHADFSVAPTELSDPGILDRIPHRVRIRRFGNAWLREDEAEPARTRHEGSDVDYVLPVLGETRTKIRVAFEDDDARMALWIARADTWSSAAVPIELSDRAGLAARDAGVWVTRGAPVDLGVRFGARREVHVRDELMSIGGFVPETVIANVWIAGAGDPPATLTTSHFDGWKPSPDLRTRVKLMIETKIRAAPKLDAPVIATIDQPEVVAVIANNLGDYRQIEIVRPYARIRGYVTAAEVTYTSDELLTHGSGSGHGFGMSHADRIDVPEGTCLFDRLVDGQVVGVQGKATTRLGVRNVETPGWSLIHIGTSWTIASVYIRDTGTDPKQPVWESCTQPAHR